MIGSLRGRVVDFSPPLMVVEVAGVGFELQVPVDSGDYRKDQEVLLLTHLVAREDVRALYGFADRLQRDLFRLLIRVRGISPQIALRMLSAMTAEDLIHCLSDEDLGRLCGLPGIGKRTAERLILETRDRLAGFAVEAVAKTGGMPASSRQPVADAVAALIALGYSEREAQRAITAVVPETEIDSGALVRLALNSLGGAR